jgi:hypothetical protein
MPGIIDEKFGEKMIGQGVKSIIVGKQNLIGYP